MTNRVILWIWAGVLTTLAPLDAWAQRDAGYDRSLVSQVRIDLRDLGYPPLDVIPPDESAVTALAVAPDGKLYGATSGKRSHLFVLDPAHGYVLPLGFLDGVTSVEGSLVVSGSGDVFVGAAPGGHLLRYSGQKGASETVPQVSAAVKVSDLGAPVAGEGISALAIDRGRRAIYGLTKPSGHFFSYDIEVNRFTVQGKVAEREMPGENFEKARNIGRAIAIAADGSAYTSGEDGRLYRFSGALKRLDMSVPSVPGREVFNRVDSWAAGGDGDLLYGGTSDGYLFVLDTKGMRVRNLGKPFNRYRLRGLVQARNGRVYGVGGDNDEMAQLFSYDPAGGTYELLGMVDVNRRPYYSWQAYVIDCATIGADGTVYLGQSERKSKLYIYHPEH
jgi:hypothetical protein